MKKTLFLVAGEVSGDSHGSAMIRALPEDAFALHGLGGPGMSETSSSIENWLDDAAVLGLWEVLKKYSYFKRKMADTVARISQINPNGVVLIDYPGFNLRLCKRLRANGYDGKLIYYISPQVWAWKKGRIREMARWLDLMICIFPFEKPLFEEGGLKTVYCGHPLVDSLADVKSLPIERDSNLVALLPGSREREVAALYPPMLEAAAILLSNNPDLHFATSGATDRLSQVLREMVKKEGLEEKFEVSCGNSQKIMRRASVGAVASGTATLEAAILELPYCLTYKVAWLTAFAARRVMKVPYLGIVNVIAGREIVTELLQEDARGDKIASQLQFLMEDSSARSAMRADLREITSQLGEGSAHQNAAQAIVTLFE